MRVFWALMAVLVLATGALLAARGGGDGSPASLTSRTGEEPAARGAPGADIPDSGGAIGPIEPTPVPAEPEDSEAARSDDDGEVVVVDIGRSDEPSVEFDDEPMPVEGDLANEAPVDEGVVEAAAEAPAGEAPAVPEGATMLNGIHAVTGAGTAEDPYVIDFDLLVALEQDYEPKVEGKKEVPEWIGLLDGKHVKITGFIGFPFIAPSADECMVMLNQWDGCCIGVPPTPYDAVEVQLAEAVDLSRGVPNYGTVQGVFRTDPYLVNGWLIGLYLMEDAELMQAGSKNQAGF